MIGHNMLMMAGELVNWRCLAFTNARIHPRLLKQLLCRFIQNNRI